MWWYRCIRNRETSLAIVPSYLNAFLQTLNWEGEIVLLHLSQTAHSYFKTDYFFEKRDNPVHAHTVHCQLHCQIATTLFYFLHIHSLLCFFTYWMLLLSYMQPLSSYGNGSMQHPHLLHRSSSSTTEELFSSRLLHRNAERDSFLLYRIKHWFFFTLPKDVLSLGSRSELGLICQLWDPVRNCKIPVNICNGLCGGKVFVT